MIIIPTLQMGKWRLREVKNTPKAPSYCMVGLGFKLGSLWLTVSNHSAITLTSIQELCCSPNQLLASNPALALIHGFRKHSCLEEATAVHSFTTSPSHTN